MGCGASTDAGLSEHHHEMIKNFGNAINSKTWDDVKSLISDNFEYQNKELLKDNKETPMTSEVI